MELSKEELEYCEFILTNKTVKQKDIDVHFGGAAVVTRLENRDHVKKYIAQKRIEKERERQQKQNSQARIFDNDILALSRESILEILKDPTNDKHVDIIKFVYAADIAYVVQYNKSLAEKDVAEGTKSRFMPRIVKNDPRTAS